MELLFGKPDIKNLFADISIRTYLLLFCVLLIAAFIIYFAAYKSLAVLLCIIFAIASFMNIKNILYIFIFAIILLPKMNMVPIPGTYIAIRSEDFLLIFVSLTALFYSLLKGKAFTMPKMIFPILFFIFATFLSLIMGIHQNTIINAQLGYLFFLRRIEYIIPFFLAYWIFDEGDIAKIKNVFLATFVITAAIAVMQYFQMIGGFYLGEYISAVGERIFSTFSGPYEYAFYLAIIFSFCLVEYFRENKGRILAVLIPAYYLLLLTAARITIASFFVGAVILAFMEKKLKLLLILLTAVLIVSLIASPNIAKGRFFTLFGQENLPLLTGAIEDGGALQPDLQSKELLQSEGIDLSTVYRGIKWVSIFRQYMNYPVFGLGPSAFGEAVDGNYLRVLAENGIVGFLAFVWLMGSILIVSYRGYKNDRGDELSREYSLFIFVSVLIFLINALVTDVFEASKFAILFWFLTGILFKVVKKEGKAKMGPVPNDNRGKN